MVMKTTYESMTEVVEMVQKVWDVSPEVAHEMVNRRISAGPEIFTAQVSDGFVFARISHKYFYPTSEEKVAVIEHIHVKGQRIGGIEDLIDAVKLWAKEQGVHKVALACPIGKFDIYGGFDFLGFKSVRRFELHEMEV